MPKRNSKIERMPAKVPYLTGRELLEQYNEELFSGELSEAALIKRYGREPWFLNYPDLPPPYSRFPVLVEDVQGRGYNFPRFEPELVHVRVPRHRDHELVGEPRLEVPQPDEWVELKDGRKFLVKDTLYDARLRTNTAALRIEWRINS